MEFDKILKLLSEEQMYANENFVPIIRPNSAKYLYDFVKDKKINTVLEIGTAIGYSGSIMLSAGATKLKTIDINDKSLSVAKNTFSKLGFSDRVEIVNKDAKVVLQELVSNDEKFDLIFLDGAKGQYINYLPNLKKLLNKYGYIFADNVLLSGMVESKEKIPHRKRTMVVNLRKYLELINTDEDFDTNLIRLEDTASLLYFYRVPRSVSYDFFIINLLSKNDFSRAFFLL